MSYGKALLPGEGAAIAQFVQQNLRIPRRGEIGWSGTEIEGLESQGCKLYIYVLYIIYNSYIIYTCMSCHFYICICLM